jgi:periplasmic protein TonB
MANAEFEEFNMPFSIQNSASSILRRAAMPQEFLRDVLRTGDATNRARRRLSVLPISIAAHAIAVTAFVMSPFVTAVEMPVIASPGADWMPTVNPEPPSPPPPPRTTPEVAPNPSTAPTEAPEGIAPEPPVRPTAPSDVGVAGGVDVGVSTGPGALTDNSKGYVPVPPPMPAPEPSGPVRPGGRIREPRKIVHVPPVYPEIARLSKKEGKVILEALLDVTGRVESVKVLRSEVFLDDAAIRAVKQWRYTPTELNGVPVPVLMTITVVFSLDTR